MKTDDAKDAGDLGPWWFEDIIVGQVHEFGAAKVKAEDIGAFSERFAPYLPLRPREDGPADEPAAPQALVYALWSRLLYDETDPWPIRARLGQDALRWFGTAHAGDTLSIRLTFVAKDDVAKDHGLVITSHDVTRQDGGLVLSLMTRTLMDKKTPQP